MPQNERMYVQNSHVLVYLVLLVQVVWFFVRIGFLKKIYIYNAILFFIRFVFSIIRLVNWDIRHSGTGHKDKKSTYSTTDKWNKTEDPKRDRLVALWTSQSMQSFKRAKSSTSLTTWFGISKLLATINCVHVICFYVTTGTKMPDRCTKQCAFIA